MQRFVEEVPDEHGIFSLWPMRELSSVAMRSSRAASGRATVEGGVRRPMERSPSLDRRAHALASLLFGVL